LERDLAQRFAFPENIRLGCQLRVRGELSIRRLVLDAEDQMLASRPLLENLPTAVGVERPMAILFADIRGFTTFSENLLPYDIVHALNRYFFHMGKVIYAHGGEINNYMGDGLIALFSKGDESECCGQAVQAGLEMIREMDAGKDYLESSYGRSFGLGIGVHYGEVIDGTIGYRETQRRTVIGDAVNFASRVESMTKEFGVPFLVSDVVYQSLKERGAIRFHPREVSFIRGKTGLHLLYEVGNSF
jgi:adenylate cyclase